MFSAYQGEGGLRAEIYAVKFKWFSPEVFLTISLCATELVYWFFCMGIVFGRVGSVCVGDMGVGVTYFFNKTRTYGSLGNFKVGSLGE